MNIKTGSILVIAITTTACSLAPIKEVKRHKFNGSYNQAVASMTNLTQKCWTLRSKPFKHDNINPIVTSDINNHKITIGRDQSDISFFPFANIIVSKKTNGSSEIIVEEGDAAYGTRYDVEGSVSRWLQGNKKCRPLK